MTPKQILDSFSETLMHDERILSAPERALLATLLQHARAAANGNEETQRAVRNVIASAVGETVAQRAFSVLGTSIVEHILENGSSLPSELQASEIYGVTPKDPEPPGVKAPRKPVGTPTPPTPSPDPEPPGVRKPRHAPVGTPTPPSPSPDPEPPGVRKPVTTPAEPQSPGVHRPNPKAPQPPTSGVDTGVVASATVAVVERPSTLKAQCVVLDEFLAPQELEELTRFTLAHEADFMTSEVVSPNEDHGIVNYEHRRSRVLMDLAEQQDVIIERVKSVLPQILERLGMDPSAIADVEAQVTASNDGDFFRFHSDNANERVASRYLTFVYFFHREPRHFEGGELRIHDARLEDGAYVSDGRYQTIVPRQNQIVFFPCELLHEITPVKCPSGVFADSRFTLNGWLRR